MISKSKDQKQTLWSRVDKFNRPKGTIDGNRLVENKLMFKNDVWARKIIWKDQLMIACIRTHVESIGSKWRCLRILTNIARHMESIHNASRQVLQSNKLLRIFGGSNSISKTIVKHMNNWWMSRYSISARIIHRGIQVTKNSKAVSSKDYRNNDEYFMVSCNNKTNWGWM